MNNAALSEAQWAQIDHVLLDLDGTLLDLEFDNHFWHTRVPQAWGAVRGLEPEAARALLQPRFAAREGTLEWYSTEYWSRELQLDIAALKHGEAARIRWLPGARRFLKAARARNKELVLLTNAHPQALALKHERTGVLEFFDASFSSHALGAPKEDARFWDALQALRPFDPLRTLFADDSASVLRAARAAGIAQIRAIRRPDSARAPRAHEHFAAIDALADLLEAG